MTENSMIEKIDQRIGDIFHNPIFPIIVVFSIGFVLRLYFTPFDQPSRSQDAFVFILTALSFQESLENIGGRYLMWSGLLSIIFSQMDFIGYNGYFTIIRLVSILLSAISGVILYLIATQMMKKKFALLSMGFFIIDPNIIENSIFGMSESLFILLGLISFYFAISKNSKFFLLTFLFAGLAFDTRPNGIVLLIIAILASYFRFKPKKQFIKITAIGFGIFLIIISPTIVDNTSQFTNLKYFDPTHTKSESPSYEARSIHVGNQYLTAFVTEITHFFRIAVPYMGIFAFFGFLISFKNFNFQTKLVLSSIILSLLVGIPQYTASVEFKNLLFITPFFAIFAGLGIEYLAHDKKIKNILLICLVLGLLLVSYDFLRDRQPDNELIIEKEKFAEFFVSNYEGRVVATDWNYIFHNIEYTIGKSVRDNISDASIVLIIPNYVIHDKTELEEFIVKNKLDYIIIDDEENIRFPFSYDIYFNESNYPFLKKVFDSDENDYIKYRVKIFKVDYNKLE